MRLESWGRDSNVRLGFGFIFISKPSMLAHNTSQESADPICARTVGRFSITVAEV